MAPISRRAVIKDEISAIKGLRKIERTAVDSKLNRIRIRSMLLGKPRTSGEIKRKIMLFVPPGQQKKALKRAGEIVKLSQRMAEEEILPKGTMDYNSKEVKEAIREANLKEYLMKEANNPPIKVEGKSELKIRVGNTLVTVEKSTGPGKFFIGRVADEVACIDTYTKGEVSVASMGVKDPQVERINVRIKIMPDGTRLIENLGEKPIEIIQGASKRIVRGIDWRHNPEVA